MGTHFQEFLKNLTCGLWQLILEASLLPHYISIVWFCHICVEIRLLEIYGRSNYYTV